MENTPSAGAASAIGDWIGSGPGKVPGAVAIGCAGGKLQIRCFGVADVATGRPMAADTVGWLASNTKAIACALVLSYVEEGKLSLDEPIFRYLPEWRGEKVPTLRQCMSHTSGLPFFPEMPIDRRPVQLLSRLGAAGEMASASDWTSSSRTQSGRRIVPSGASADCPRMADPMPRATTLDPDAGERGIVGSISCSVVMLILVSSPR